MLFTARAAAVLAFVSGVLAQTANFDVVSKPSNWEAVPAGKPYTIEWAPTEAYNGQTVTISLIGGAEQNLQVPIKDIQTGVQSSAGKFTWTVDATLGDANVYGLVVKLESNPSIFQYSFPFKITKSTEEPKPTTISEGVKTVSLSEAPKPIVTVPVDTVVTVPCNTTVPVATKINTIVVPCNGTCPHPTGGKPAVPTGSVPVPTGPKPVVPTPVANPPVTAGAAHFGASIAVVGGLVMAALAL
jgi:hypothetical protein